MKKIARSPSAMALTEGVTHQAVRQRHQSMIEFEGRTYVLHRLHYIIWPDGRKVDVEVTEDKNGELELHQIYPSRIVQTKLPPEHLIVCVA